jgi:altronate dehydratase small subunit
MDIAYKTVMMKPNDQVAVALIDIPAGVQLTVTCQGQTHTVVLKDPIEFGHKFAVKPLQKGEDVLKYGEVIGIAQRDIAPGEHVHVHNLEGKRGRGDLVAKADER